MRQNKKCLQFFLNVSIQIVFLSLSGSLFQRIGAATENALLPYLSRL